MTELSTIRGPKTDASPAPVAESAAEAALITEQQVLFSTAAAVTVAPAKTRRWNDTIGSVAGAVRAWFVEALTPPRQQYTKRHDFLEDARMARQMYRL